MYEVGFEYEVSNTEAPWLGLVVSILDTFEVIQTSWKLKCFFFLEIWRKIWVWAQCQTELKLSQHWNHKRVSYVSAAADQFLLFFREMTAWNLRYAFTVSALRIRRVKKLRASIVQVGGCGQTESFSFEQHHCGVVLHDVSDGRRCAAQCRQRLAHSQSQSQLCLHWRLLIAKYTEATRARVKRCYAHSVALQCWGSSLS